MIHEVEVVLHLEEDYKGGHDLPDGEAGQRVLVAHDKQLAHLDDSLKLPGLVAGGLEALQQLLGLGGAGGRHCAVQNEVVHPGTEHSREVRGNSAGFKHCLEKKEEETRFKGAVRSIY